MITPLLQISQAEIEQLSSGIYSYPQTIIQKRIHAVLLKATLCLSNEMIGVVVGLHPNTVSHWVNVYKEKKYEGLLTNNYGTNTSEMEVHSESILSSFTQKPPRTAGEAALRIEEMTGIKRGEQR